MHLKDGRVGTALSSSPEASLGTALGASKHSRSGPCRGGTVSRPPRAAVPTRSEKRILRRRAREGHEEIHAQMGGVDEVSERNMKPQSWQSEQSRGRAVTEGFEAHRATHAVWGEGRELPAAAQPGPGAAGTSRRSSDSKAQTLNRPWLIRAAPRGRKTRSERARRGELTSVRGARRGEQVFRRPG